MKLTPLTRLRLLRIFFRIRTFASNRLPIQKQMRHLKFTNLVFNEFNLFFQIIKYIFSFFSSEFSIIPILIILCKKDLDFQIGKVGSKQTLIKYYYSDSKT